MVAEVVCMRQHSELRLLLAAAAEVYAEKVEGASSFYVIVECREGGGLLVEIFVYSLSS